MLELFKPISVTAGGRLHFGFLSFGNPMIPEFGGVGLMLNNPCVKLRIDPALRFKITGDKGGRAAKFTELWAAKNRPGKDLRCAITIQELIPSHRGLGSGTQLGLAVGKALGRYYGCDVKTPEELAAVVGRGQRSAIGTYGFADGGLLVDGGRTPGANIGSLQQRLPVPDDWRFVLIEPPLGPGLSGTRERDAFGSLPPVAKSVTDQLLEILEQLIVTGLQSQDVNQFGEGLFQYGRLAGECFASAQGGPFASPEIASWVRRIRNWDVAGVGQSSWGPTLFALTADQKHADLLVEKIVDTDPKIKVRIASPNNHGAIVQNEAPLHHPKPNTVSI